MNDDDHVCLCFHVSKRKIVSFCQREKPAVASLISECLSAGTGCQWCVPFIKKLHQQCVDGVENPDLPVSPEAYAKLRTEYKKTGKREADDEIQLGCMRMKTDEEESADHADDTD